MTKSKKFLAIAIATLATVGIFAFGAACSGCSDEPEEPSVEQPTASVQSVSVTGANSVEAGKTITLTASVTMDDGSTYTGTIDWSSSDTSVATVAGGVVTGVKEGTATITAKAEGVSGTISITVTAASPSGSEEEGGGTGTGEGEGDTEGGTSGDNQDTSITAGEGNYVSIDFTDNYSNSAYTTPTTNDQGETKYGHVSSMPIDLDEEGYVVLTDSSAKTYLWDGYFQTGASSSSSLYMSVDLSAYTSDSLSICIVFASGTSTTGDRSLGVTTSYSYSAGISATSSGSSDQQTLSYTGTVASCTDTNGKLYITWDSSVYIYSIDISLKSYKGNVSGNPTPAIVLTPVDAVAATCTEAGNIAYWYYTDDATGVTTYYSDANGTDEITDTTSLTIPALGHDYTTVSYTSDGWVKNCSRCDVTEALGEGDSIANYTILIDSETALNAALTAAAEDETENVSYSLKLSAAIELTNIVTISGGTVELDLAGYAVTANITDETKPNSIISITGGTVVINDSSVDGTGSVTYALESNTQARSLNVTGGTLTINGGTYAGYLALVIGESGEVTINGGTFTTASGSGYSTIQSSGTLTISGGTITCAGGYALNIVSGETTISGGSIIMPVGVSGSSENAIQLRVGASLKIEDGLITANKNEVAAIGIFDSSSAESGAKAVLTITAGTIYGTDFGVYLNGNITDTEKVEITISGGTIEGGATGVYLAGNGQYEISGGKIVGGETGVEIRAGSLEISGDVEITSKATDFKAEADGSGTTIKGAALAISQHTTGIDISVTIKDNATLKGLYAIYEANVQGNASSATIELDIENWTATGRVYSEASGYDWYVIDSNGGEYSLAGPGQGASYGDYASYTFIVIEEGTYIITSAEGEVDLFLNDNEEAITDFDDSDENYAAIYTLELKAGDKLVIGAYDEDTVTIEYYVASEDEYTLDSNGGTWELTGGTTGWDEVKYTFTVAEGGTYIIKSVYAETDVYLNDSETAIYDYEEDDDGAYIYTVTLATGDTFVLGLYGDDTIIIELATEGGSGDESTSITLKSTGLDETTLKAGVTYTITMPNYGYSYTYTVTIYTNNSITVIVNEVRQTVSNSLEITISSGDVFYIMVGAADATISIDCEKAEDDDSATEEALIIGENEITLSADNNYDYYGVYSGGLAADTYTFTLSDGVDENVKVYIYINGNFYGNGENGEDVDYILTSENPSISIACEDDATLSITASMTNATGSVTFTVTIAGTQTGGEDEGQTGGDEGNTGDTGGAGDQGTEEGTDEGEGTDDEQVTSITVTYTFAEDSENSGTYKIVSSTEDENITIAYTNTSLNCSAKGGILSMEPKSYSNGKYLSIVIGSSVASATISVSVYNQNADRTTYLSAQTTAGTDDWKAAVAGDNTNTVQTLTSSDLEAGTYYIFSSGDSVYVQSITITYTLTSAS